MVALYLQVTGESGYTQHTPPPRLSLGTCTGQLSSSAKRTGEWSVLTSSHLRWVFFHKLLESLETMQRTEKVRYLAQCVDTGAELLM